MEYSYKIQLSIENDIWNWLDASRHSSHGYDWRNNLCDKGDIEIYEKISKLKKAAADKLLKEYLERKYKNQEELICNYQKMIEKEFNDKFVLACGALEKITGKKLFVNKYIFNLTTFPRCPYNPDTGEIYFYISTNRFWVDPIENFLHEVLHFQFHHYWQDNKKSPVSKLSQDDFEFLKESLTVVIDDELKPLIGCADRGYPIHQDFRNELHKNWEKDHDFNALINYGIDILDNYKKI